ncbi:hypothetical protein F5Y17DRAFT_470520 [Xylariaceae sp. FL0594]|nr:hypothetical protein F5Y17DRAFT_470520 [Xylariaceae sp. FL0594]
MPPFFGLSQLQTAMTARALPTLEQLAAHPNHLNSSLNNRFERDNPPPYMSSSESEEEEALHHPVLARSREATLETFEDLLSKPLNDNETLDVVETLNSIRVYSPGDRYLDEAKVEHNRSANEHIHNLLKGPKGYQRRDQSSTSPHPLDPQHPINQAVQLRRNLAYRKHAPPPPRSHLKDGSSAPKAESFIICRPFHRIPVEQKGYSNPDEDGQRPTWKWRHESPSPEPEDLTCLNTDAIDFTPAEVDALETIPPNSPPRPRFAPPEFRNCGNTTTTTTTARCKDRGKECQPPVITATNTA